MWWLWMTFVVFCQHYLAQAVRPGGLQAGDLPVDRASGIVGAGQVSGGDREPGHDLAGGEEEGPL